MPSNMALPFSNGRPAGSMATSRASYAAPTSSRNSPVSSYHSSPAGSTSGSGSKLLSSILIPPDDGSAAVLEKHRLANRAAGGKRMFPPFLDRFISPYPIWLPFTSRRLLVPVPNILHPSPSTPIIPPHYRSNHPRHAKNRNGFGKGSERSLRTTVLYGLCIVLVVLLLFSRIRAAIRKSARNISLPFQDASTLVLSDEEIQRIWEWEISNGHYPSSRRLPTTVRLHRLGNPGLPTKGGLATGDQLSPTVAHFGDVSFAGDEHGSSGGKALPKGQLRAPPTFLDDVIAIGPQRDYLNVSTPQPSTAMTPEKSPPYPPRPRVDSILDLDVVMDFCDFATNQYVRDCLEILRIGAGLDPHKRVRRGALSRWRHVFQHVKKRVTPDEAIKPRSGQLEERSEKLSEDAMREANYRPEDILELIRSSDYQDHLRNLQRGQQQVLVHETEEVWSTTGGLLKAQPEPHPTHPTADPTCDPDYPKLFHVFWAGPFTDKPYLALSSFLFTQNLGLHLPTAPLQAGKGPRTQYPGSSFLDIEDGDEGLFGHSRRHNDREGQRLRNDMLRKVCRPQMWVWINPGPAAAVPNPNARADMLAELGKNPWSAPFLHPRFAEVIKFKMWNTTEQLDGVPELREHWRDLPLFNSGGVKYGGSSSKGGGTGAAKGEQSTGKEAAAAQTKEPVKIGVTVAENEAKRAVDPDGDGRGEAADVVEEELGRFGNHSVGEAAVAEDLTAATAGAGPPATDASGKPATAKDAGSKSPIAPAAPQKKGEDEMYDRVGSTSSKGYDRLSVVLSDMARFVLCHRFGGVYLDADTILLRDWEELWGWKGQFAYRWSRLEKYNTAVLKLHRHSAIGSFLFKTALANGLDFHPMTISRYTKDAHLEGLLLRLPDALFDSAWLNTEYYQRDRPPFPYFKRFEDFFDPPKESDAGPAAVGFDGFFRGAYSYHFHNFWWIPFDPSRNWPDLGPRFAPGERVARARVLANKMATSGPGPTPPAGASSSSSSSSKNDRAPKQQQQQQQQPDLVPGAATAGGGGGRGAGAGGSRTVRGKTVKEWEAELVGTVRLDQDDATEDERDLGWATVLKRTFEAYLRGERPNMYGEWLDWNDRMSDGD